MGDLEVIPGWKLEDAWPDEYAELRGVGQHTEETANPVPIRPLTESTLEIAVIESIKLGDTSALEQFVHMGTQYDSQILSILKGLHPVPIPASSLLVALIRQTHIGPAFDLSDWHLTADQLAQIISSLPTSTDIKRLNLSFNPMLIVDDMLLKVFSDCLPNLTHLFLMGCPLIPDDTAISLTHPSVFPRVICVAHPAFFHFPMSVPFPTLKPHETRFTLFANFGSSDDRFNPPGISFASLNPEATVQRLINWTYFFQPQLLTPHADAMDWGASSLASLFATSWFPDDPSTFLPMVSAHSDPARRREDPKHPAEWLLQWRTREVVRVPRANEGYRGPLSRQSQPGEWGLAIIWTSRQMQSNTYSFLRRLPELEELDADSVPGTTVASDDSRYRVRVMDYEQFIQYYASESPVSIDQGLIDTFKATFAGMIKGGGLTLMSTEQVLVWTE